MRVFHVKLQTPLSKEPSYFVACYKHLQGLKYKAPVGLRFVSRSYAKECFKCQWCSGQFEEWLKQTKPLLQEKPKS